MKKLTKNQATHLAQSSEKVWAQLKDGTIDRIYAIAWTRCIGQKTTYSIAAEIEYFYEIEETAAA
jgi:hypothetical protein